MPLAATWMDLEIIMLNEVREWEISYAITYMWLSIKGIPWNSLQNTNWPTDFEKFMVTKRDRLEEGRTGWGVWGGNVVKLGCDDGCTTVNILKFTELKNK